MTMRMTGSEALKRLVSLPTFSSGSKGVDEILGGGLRSGRLVEVFGKSNSGKTQLAMQAALMVAGAGRIAVFIDCEGTFRPERVERMARARAQETDGLLDRIEYLRVRTAAGQADSVRALAKRKETDKAVLVVMDTFTRNFSLDYPGRANLTRRQGALDIHLSEIARDAFLNKRAYLLTNRVTFSQTGGETRIGGKTMEQLVHTSLHLERDMGETRITDVSTGTTLNLGTIGDRGFD